MEIGSKLYKKVMNLQNSRSFTNDKDLEWDKIEKITKIVHTIEYDSNCNYSQIHSNVKIQL